MNLSVNKTTATHTYLKLRFLSTRKIKVFPASTQKCGGTYGPTGDKIHTRNVNDTANHHLKTTGCIIQVPHNMKVKYLLVIPTQTSSLHSKCAATKLLLYFTTISCCGSVLKGYLLVYMFCNSSYIKNYLRRPT